MIRLKTAAVQNVKFAKTKCSVAREKDVIVDMGTLVSFADESVFKTVRVKVIGTHKVELGEGVQQITTSRRQAFVKMNIGIKAHNKKTIAANKTAKLMAKLVDSSSMIVDTTAEMRKIR